MRRPEPIEGLYVVLSGHFSIRVDRGAGPRKVMEWRGGDVSGVLPYSRLLTPPGDIVAEEQTEVVIVHRDDFPELTRECYELTAILVHVMLDRARHFTSTDLHDEKMLSLGKFAAGLAHELNNPASAVVRSAKELADRLEEVETASRVLGAVRLSDPELAAVHNTRELCLAADVKSVRSPIEEADREDAIADWLIRHGRDATAAEQLSQSAVTFEGLDRLAKLLDGKTLDISLRWIAAGCVTRKLASEIETAASRIHGLVAAVKGFTHMDQASVSKPVDISQGLSDTLAVLRAKARSKSVSVRLEISADLPRIEGFGGELNQVWVNLIDNALEAVPELGHVEITATRQDPSVVVSVVDDGPGIPAEIQERIFDPFFTTKAVGQGIGLGLDIARRLVCRHDDELDVYSKPGRTEFRVTLPTSQGAAKIRHDDK